MSHDTLFQLGMDSVLLNASQKEDTFVTCALASRVEAGCTHRPNLRFALAANAVTGLFRPEMKRRGNSAKALTLRAGSAVVLS